MGFSHKLRHSLPDQMQLGTPFHCFISGHILASFQTGQGTDFLQAALERKNLNLIPCQVCLESCRTCCVFYFRIDGLVSIFIVGAQSSTYWLMLHPKHVGTESAWTGMPFQASDRSRHSFFNNRIISVQRIATGVLDNFVPVCIFSFFRTTRAHRYWRLAIDVGILWNIAKCIPLC